MRHDFSYDPTERAWGLALAWAMVISVTLIITALVAAFAFQAQAVDDITTVETQLSNVFTTLSGSPVTVEILP